MTATTDEGTRPSAALAAEIRAQIARQGTSAAAVALELGVPGAWMSRRIGRGADVSFTFEEVVRISQALGVDAESLIVDALRACRDSNPKPSVLERLADYLARVVAPFELNRCPICGAWTMDGTCRTPHGSDRQATPDVRLTLAA